MARLGRQIRVPPTPVVWALLPLFVALASTVLIWYQYQAKTPGFVSLDNLPMGNLTKAQEQTLTMVTELNKFLISLATLMFGAVAFFLMQYRTVIQLVPVNLAFLFALVFLGITYLFSFRTYSQVTAELAQNALAITPGRSRILYYLEMEFWTFLAASLTMLSIFVFVLLTAKTKLPAGPGGETG